MHYAIFLRQFSCLICIFTTPRVFVSRCFSRFTAREKRLKLEIGWGKVNLRHIFCVLRNIFGWFSGFGLVPVDHPRCPPACTFSWVLAPCLQLTSSQTHLSPKVPHSLFCQMLQYVPSVGKSWETLASCVFRLDFIGVFKVWPGCSKESSALELCQRPGSPMVNKPGKQCLKPANSRLT